ncbi:MAG: hypothetical protein K8I03_05095 [Ignavibacteria bacterium]|nr:hypothetical protein [Ignavibacteria bacterium]
MKKLLLAALVLSVFAASCGKKSSQDNNSPDGDKKEETKEQTKSTEQTVNQDSINAVKEQSANKEKMVKWALEDSKIVDDPNGQFAIEAEASSTYAPEGSDNTSPYSPGMAAGKPNVEVYSDDGRSWVSKEADRGIEWLKLTFAKPVNATEVRVRQNIGPGAIIKVELIDTEGKSHIVYEGVDKTKYEPVMIQWFIAKFEKTAYKTKAVKLTLSTNLVDGWNEIDAVQLIGE